MINIQKKKAKPTREQLLALANQLKDAPTVSDEAQLQLWNEIGGAQGWAAMTADEKATFVARWEAVA